ENAERWINYLERPEVSADITNTSAIPTANKSAMPLVEPSLRDDPSLFPTPAVLAKSFPWRSVPNQVKQLSTRLWNDMKNGR
ncbi:MAG TPA: spermidine/putrescine ABC transporter substrate-binding protein PotF, partial [Stellaceae bacterium]|nr:spermidine/putrescine ABC transporter substrate-binding protein PotF [Stellaceae bacterium]